MSVPFFDMRAHYEGIKQELDSALLDTVASSHYILGPKLQQFENEFAKYCGAKYAVGVGNGLDAIRLSLKALGVGPGDEVLVPGHTFIATALAVVEAGASPVLVDIDENTFNLDPQKIADARTAKTKAIIAVHLYGRPAPMEQINKIAREFMLPVIEDAAQAHGSIEAGLRAGNMGTLAAFSFYPTKNLGAMGDGGAVLTSDSDLASRLSLLRNYGQRERYNHVQLGTNTRLDEIQAAVLSVKLKHLDGWNQRRRKIADMYRERLSAVPGLRLPVDHPGHVYHLFVVRCQKRDQLLKYLASKNIGALIHYPNAMNQHAALQETARTAPAGVPVSEKICREVLSLPIFPEMSLGQVEQTCAAVKEFFG